METKNVWESYSGSQEKKCNEFALEYIDFLSNNKTERECTATIKAEAEAAGYVDINTLIGKDKKLSAGDKVYAVNKGKAVVMFKLGSLPLEKGMNILGAHIDSPRMDIKQNPLYEDGGFALLDTHYYGGIKKYQWVAIPLAIHGVVALTDGSVVDIKIGEKESDPVFFVSDLLIHLAAEQMEKKASKVIEGEALDIIVGNKPITIKKEKKG